MSWNARRRRKVSRARYDALVILAKGELIQISNLGDKDYRSVFSRSSEAANEKSVARSKVQLQVGDIKLCS